MVIARDIGQVRDVVHGPGRFDFDIAYPTVDEAVTRIANERERP
ncbi:MAG: hypothetical protein U0R26_10205 [Solirubrobacterales bacterium]